MSMMTLDMKNIKRRISDDGKTLEVFIPMQLKKRGGRKEVIIPDNPEGTSQQNLPLVIAIARAHRWNELLETYRVGSITELAEHNGVDPAYVRRFLHLTLLAPDIIERILDGKEPSGLSLAKLLREMPVLWGEQRKIFGTLL